MAVLYLNHNKTFSHPEKYDPDEKRYYSVGWKPPARLNAYEYLLDDIILPDTANGFYYVCTKPGVSGAIAPTYSVEIGGSTTDGTVKWKSLPYDLELRAGDSMVSTWVVPDTVTTDNTGGDGCVNWIRVTAVTAGTESFTLTNRVTITRLNAKVEVFEGSILIKVKI